MNVQVKDSFSKSNKDEKIIEFIKRRFPEDCDWTSGNCYFFALILQKVFGGEIVYEQIEGHFLLKIGKRYYDWTGNVSDKYRDFKDSMVLFDYRFDEALKQRLIRDCIL